MVSDKFMNLWKKNLIAKWVEGKYTKYTSILRMPVYFLSKTINISGT